MSYELKPGEKLSHGIRRIAKKQINRIMDELEARSGHPAEAVHEARKNLKKARAAVRLVRPILGRRIYRRENRDFRRVARMLSPLRDAEVLLKTVERLRADSPGAQAKPVLERLEEALKRRRDEVLSQACADGGDCESVLRTAQCHVKKWPVQQLDWPELGLGVKRTFKRGVKAFQTAEKTRSPLDLHEWRKRVKDLWYELRILKPAQPKVIGGFADELKRLGEFLGDDHDLVMVRDAAERMALTRRELRLLRGVIDSRRAELQRAAFELGHRLFEEKPADLACHIESYGKAWCRKGLKTGNSQNVGNKQNQQNGGQDKKAA